MHTYANCLLSLMESIMALHMRSHKDIGNCDRICGGRKVSQRDTLLFLLLINSTMDHFNRSMFALLYDRSTMHAFVMACM